MEKIIYTNSKNKTIELGKKISKNLFRGATILLYGDLGAGKTTFTKGIGIGLGIEDDINSPTFNIAKCYFNKGNLNLYHIDAYRLEDVPKENKDIGLEELIEGDGVCIIEWPIFIKEMINEDDSLIITINITDDNRRKFDIKSNSSKYDKLIEEIK